MSSPSPLELATRATLALHRRLEVAAPGASVALTSRCCHAMPSERESRLAGAHADAWRTAERKALAKAADWARRHGFTVETRTHDAQGASLYEANHSASGCSAYDALIVHRSAA